MASLSLRLDRLYQISYDKFGDVLYIRSDESRDARKSIADDDGFLWRFGTADALSPAGFTILDFNYNWQNKVQALAERIKSGMAWSDHSVEILTQAILSISDDRRKIGSEMFAGLPDERPVTIRAAR